MADRFVDSASAGASSPYTSWATAATTLALVDAVDTAGDRILFKNTSEELLGASVTYALAGTLAAPSMLVSTDGADPPAYLAGAKIGTSTGATIGIGFSGYLCAAGLVIESGTASAQGTIQLGGTTDDSQRYDDCVFRLTGANSNGRVGIGQAGTAEHHIILNRPAMKFSNASQGITVLGTKSEVRGLTIEAGSTALTQFIKILGSSRGFNAIFEGCDFRNLGASVALVAAITSNGTILFRSCRFPDSFTGTLIAAGAIGGPGIRVEAHNCDNADTNYRLWIEDFCGTIRDETTIVRTGGASDGTTTYSLKLTSNANANFAVPLASIELPAIWNDTTGAAKTVTVEFVHDSVTNLKDDEIWLEVQHLGASGVPLSTFVTDCKANFIATAADQTDSSETWTTTGLTNPNTQKLSVTFTPQEKCYIQARVYLAKASTTVYVDPKLTVA